MAGMLAGVECARRRKFHKNNGLLDPSYNISSSTRRSFLCLYTSSHEHNLTSRLSKERNATSQEYEDEKLGEVAREAKQRLDERLSSQWKSQNKRVAKGYKSLGQWRGLIS
ncbi:uncharacterized protein LOC107024514 [Solanum pennellii]|uniref:Uncharacterized protein LOC107024514 n=1 Tax=Solanum pennellii TaxID=28526 RepID=A0ABM1H6E8_SOLPN|nr:uncharacterized protein LOC107024514 [Solanum pennellii]